VNISWVTPLNRRSAIGRFSAAVVDEFAKRGHAVQVIRSELDELAGEAFSVSCRVRRWRDVTAEELARESDIVIVNIGDHYGLNAGVLAYLDAIPCLGVFHDSYIYNLFNRWVVVNDLGEMTHQRHVQDTYGNEALALGLQAWKGTAELNEIASTIPMTEWLAKRCAGAVAHSRFYRTRLEVACPGPIAFIPLCYEGREVELQPKNSSADMVVAIIGIINPNKSADLVIQAIAGSAMLRERCQLRLVGAVTNGEKARLIAFCHSAGWDRVEFLGEVDDATLTTELERADIIACIRRPALEGASASAIEAMKAARPIIVANSGFYADLPDDCVFKVRADPSAAELTAVIETLVRDPQFRLQTAQRAREWAIETFSTERYVTAMEVLIEDVIGTGPLFDLATRLAGDLSTLGITPQSRLIPRVSSRIDALFGVGPRDDYRSEE
jgi:glycosyltransferase involved in cell wall biosynthesis